MSPILPEEYSWVMHGTPVWYRPSLKDNKRYAGTVEGTPWPVGGSGEDATWVVHLKDMERSYRNGQRSTVPAAYLGALEPRASKTAPHRALVSFDRGEHTFWLHTLGNNGHPYPTQQETTLQDLADALTDLEERGIYTPANHHVDAAIERLDKILDEGEQHGKFGGEKLQAFAERILQLQQYPNLSWEHLAQQLEAALDTGERPSFPSEAINHLVDRLLELRAHPDPGFGVDPEDSASLCKLRQACDDNLIWPSVTDEEHGDYEKAVAHTGTLAKIAVGFRDALRRLTP